MSRDIGEGTVSGGLSPPSVGTGCDIWKVNGSSVCVGVVYVVFTALPKAPG